MNGGARLERAIDAAGPRLAMASYLTAGYPSMSGFKEVAAGVADHSDVLELGVPFSDPIADGPTIQRSSAAAISAGVDMKFILDQVRLLHERVPVVIMSYLNPLLAFGLAEFVTLARDAGVDGLIVPDLPLEESHELREMLRTADIAAIQLVSPNSSGRRIAELCNASEGFVYAVAATGVTGGETHTGDELDTYLANVKKAATIPVLAGFGIRTPRQMNALAGRIDGVVVGSALIEAIDNGVDPGAFVAELKAYPNMEAK